MQQIKSKITNFEYFLFPTILCEVCLIWVACVCMRVCVCVEWDENDLMTKNKTNYYAYVASLDFLTCRQITPSYRELPTDIPLPSCSARCVALCVINHRSKTFDQSQEQNV